MLLSKPTPYTVRSLPIRELHVRNRRRVLAAADAMLVVVLDVDVEAGALAQRVDERIDGPVAVAVSSTSTPSNASRATIRSTAARRRCAACGDRGTR
jgi:hypothetical protein